MATTPPDLAPIRAQVYKDPRPKEYFDRSTRARARASRTGSTRPCGWSRRSTPGRSSARAAHGAEKVPVGRPGDPRAEPLLVHGPLLRRRVRSGGACASWRSRSCSSRRCSGSSPTAACSRCGAATRTRRRSSPRTGSSTAAARSSCTARAAARARARCPSKPKRGIGRLALESGAPVVPVAIHGSSHVRNWKRLQFPKVTVRYGDAIRWRRSPTRRATSSRPSRTRSSRASRCSTRRSRSSGPARPRALDGRGGAWQRPRSGKGRPDPRVLPRHPPASHPAPAAPRRATASAGLLTGAGITLSGAVPDAVGARLRALGAGEGTDVLVHAAAEPRDADGVRAALDEAWDAIRATMLPPGPGLIVLLAPAPGDAHRAAARAGLENLARTLSIEWAPHGIRPVADPPGRRRPTTSRRARRLPRVARRRLLQRLRVHPSLAHGTSTESSVGESRATTYSAGSVAERLTTMCVSRGGT